MSSPLKSHSRPKPVPPPPVKGERKATAPRVERWSSVYTGFGYPMPLRSPGVPEWRATLADCGYPTTAVVLDFESYFDDEYSMRGGKLSTGQYIRDSRWEVLGCSCTIMDQPFLDPEQRTVWWNGETGVDRMLGLLKSEFGDNLEGCTVVAQNTRFDASIMAFRYGIYPRYVTDVLGLARHWDARDKNDLGHLCKQWDLKGKGDTKVFKGWTNRKRFKRSKSRKKGPKLPIEQPRMTEEQVEELYAYANNDAAREWELFTLLLPRLSRPEIELPLIQHTLELFYKPTIRTDPAKAEELIEKMRAEEQRYIDVVNEHRQAKGDPEVGRSDISGDNAFESLLSFALTDAGDWWEHYTKPTKQEGKEKVFALAKEDPQRELLANHENEMVRSLMAARIAVKSWPLHIKRVQRIIDQSAAEGGLLPVPLKYHGAHTGRWSGGEKINLQNLGSRDVDELIKAIRQLLVADDDHEFVIVDLSAVEGRGTPWIAGQWDLVEKFARGEEIYCGFAEQVLGYKVRKPVPEPLWEEKGCIPAIENRLKWARNSIGKIGVLGCGYGMGPEKAVSYAKGAIDLPLGKKVVKVFRDTNPEIVRFWREVEQAFTYTLKYGKSCEMPRGLRFDQTKECDVIITLPSGRELKYHAVRMGEGRFGPTPQIYNAVEHKWVNTWGGSLTENIVQGFCRDILAEAMMKLQDMGYPTVLHVHDELVLRVKRGQGAEVRPIAESVMSITPDWAPGLPLGAEGVVSNRFGGH